MAERESENVGPMLERLSARFELVIEAVSGWQGQLDSLREELRGEFVEVGSQIRFLLGQLGENREGLVAMRAELGAEMVRLGEALGATRVEFRQSMAQVNGQLRPEVASVAAELRRELAETLERLDHRFEAGLAGTRAALREELTRAGSQPPSGPAASAEALARELRVDLKQTTKTLANLSKKFDRFDDRISVQVKDHDTRLRKLDRRARG